MKLFSSTDRDASHAELERILKSGEHPRAECREFSNDAEPYQVWSEPDVREPAPPSPPPVALPAGVTIRFTDDELGKIAMAVAAQLKGEKA